MNGRKAVVACAHERCLFLNQLAGKSRFSRWPIGTRVYDLPCHNDPAGNRCTGATGYFGIISN